MIRKFQDIQMIKVTYLAKDGLLYRLTIDPKEIPANWISSHGQGLITSLNHWLRVAHIELEGAPPVIEEDPPTKVLDCTIGNH